MRKALVTVGVLGLMFAAVPAANAAPGKAIQDACGASFGQLVGPAKSSGTSFHGNYAGGAKALVPFAEAHGCG